MSARHLTLTLPLAARRSQMQRKEWPLASTPKQGLHREHHHRDGAAQGAGGTHSTHTLAHHPAWPGCWPTCPTVDRAALGAEGLGASRQLPPPCTSHPRAWRRLPRAERTHDAVLNTETQLVFEVWPLDEDSGDWRAADDVELHLCLALQTL